MSEQSPGDRLRTDELAIRLGGWSATVRGNEIAELCWRGVRLLRGVVAVVRDADWNTIPATVVEMTSSGTPASVLVQMVLRFTDEQFGSGIDYEGQLHLYLGDDGGSGELAITFEGGTEVPFERNRIGLVLLHPLEDAGRPVTVLHSAGATQDGVWPERISPHQPFTDVTGFRWRRDGVRVDLTLSGDVFETEDQRNWTDASFKTYSTPLSLPFPVHVEPGDKVGQAVRMSVRGAPSAEVIASTVEPVRLGSPTGTVIPALGVSISEHTRLEEVRLLGGDLESLLIEVTPNSDLSEPITLARQSGIPLDVRLVTDLLGEVDRRLVELSDTPVARVAVFDPIDHVTPRTLWPRLPEAVPGATAVVGTRAHFTELNRRFADLPEDAPALTFSLTPQMHADTVPHILDSLQTQTLVAREAVRLADGRPVHIGPITLRRRFNAVATRANPPIEAADPLLRSDFAAAWLVASVAALSLPGVASLAYFAVDGPHGLVDQNGLSPAGETLRVLSALRGLPQCAVETPAGVAGLAVLDDDRRQVWLANLTGRHRRVRLDSQDDPIPLPPWGVAHRTV